MNIHRIIPDPGAAELDRMLDSRANMRSMVAICDEAHEIMVRTSAIVNRVCPLPCKPASTSRWNPHGRVPSVAEVQAYEAARRERNRLHNEIRRKLTAKVRQFNRSGL